MKKWQHHYLPQMPDSWYYVHVSAHDVLEQVKALPLRERRKFFDFVHELETAEPIKQRHRRIRWPDAAARRRRIFGNRILPNLVLLAREEERY